MKHYKTGSYLLSQINALILIGLISLAGYLVLVDMPRRSAEALYPDKSGTTVSGVHEAVRNTKYKAEDLQESNLQFKDDTKEKHPLLEQDAENARGFSENEPVDISDDLWVVLPPEISVHGIFYDSDNRRASSAILSIDEGDQDVYAIGDSFISRGSKWKIVDITDISC